MEHESLSMPVHTFTVSDIFNHTVNLSDTEGKVTLLHLWATWCPSCRAETPVLVELQRRYKSSGLEVIALSVDEDPALVRQFCLRYNVNYPVAMVDSEVEDFFAAVLRIPHDEVRTRVPIPTSILLGRDGRINRIYVGRDLRALDPALSDLLGVESLHHTE
jgi:thiol-disulfide isomerase/thioredoxin